MEIFEKKNHNTGSLLNVTTLNGSQLLYTQQHNIYSSLVHWPTLRHELSKRHTHQRSLSHMHLICIYAMRASGKTQTDFLLAHNFKFTSCVDIQHLVTVCATAKPLLLSSEYFWFRPY